MKRITFLILAGIIISVSTISCKKDEDTTTEFIADNNTFKSFANWPVGGEFVGADPSLGAAHGGNDSTTTRKVYFKDNVAPSDGTYPIGAVIVKHSHNTNGQVNEFTAMTKRGNDFNPEGNDWEYFMLTENGDIATDNNGDPMRGAKLMNGMCMGCHSKASHDYIFTQR